LCSRRFYWPFYAYCSYQRLCSGSLNIQFMPIAVVSCCAALISVPPTVHFTLIAVVSVCAASLLPSILCLLQLSVVVQSASYRPFYAYCSCQRMCSEPPTVNFMPIAVVSGCAECLLPSILCLVQLSAFVQRASYRPFLCLLQLSAVVQRASYLPFYA